MSSSSNAPVVLIHGWGGNFTDTWQKPGIDALLADIGREVVGLDLLGHGDQDKPHDPLEYVRLPEWLLENLPVAPKVDVVGFSLGALTVLRSLIAAPERFGKVVLAGIGDGVFEKSAPDGNRRIVDALEGNSTEEDSFARMFVHYGNQPRNDIKALTAIMKRPPAEPIDPSALASITNEILVVIGDKDFTAPADKLAQAFPHGKITILRNTDHFATTDSFSFIDALLDFLLPE
jgi:pimeloyl-ACP methyl ester carboxylesterase